MSQAKPDLRQNISDELAPPSASTPAQKHDAAEQADGEARYGSKLDQMLMGEKSELVNILRGQAHRLANRLIPKATA